LFTYPSIFLTRQGREFVEAWPLGRGVWQGVALDSLSFSQARHTLPFYALRAVRPFQRCPKWDPIWIVFSGPLQAQPLMKMNFTQGKERVGGRRFGVCLDTIPIYRETRRVPNVSICMYAPVSEAGKRIWDVENFCPSRLVLLPPFCDSCLSVVCHGRKLEFLSRAQSDWAETWRRPRVSIPD
jgi:hypothetical protein